MYVEGLVGWGQYTYGNGEWAQLFSAAVMLLLDVSPL